MGISRKVWERKTISDFRIKIFRKNFDAVQQREGFDRQERLDGNEKIRFYEFDDLRFHRCTTLRGTNGLAQHFNLPLVEVLALDFRRRTKAWFRLTSFRQAEFFPFSGILCNEEDLRMGHPRRRQLKRQMIMRIRVGYELVYDCPQPVPMLLVLNIHYSRAADILVPDQVTTSPAIPMSAYRDSFGNWCSKMTAPEGRLTIASTAVVNDSGNTDPYMPAARQHPIEELPDDALQFLLASRYCETEFLTDISWNLFGKTEPGWQRVQAICDFVHQHISFGYEHARPTKTAFEVFQERKGVCRDYAHLAITFCRCLNIPARYCTGYLGDIGMEPPFGPMDFAGWFEAYLGGQWYTFDPRNNIPRIGRILIARGRDATDVAIATTFGPNTLTSFKVITDEVMEAV